MAKMQQTIRESIRELYKCLSESHKVRFELESLYSAMNFHMGFNNWLIEPMEFVSLVALELLSTARSLPIDEREVRKCVDRANYRARRTLSKEQLLEDPDLLLAKSTRSQNSNHEYNQRLLSTLFTELQVHLNLLELSLLESLIDGKTTKQIAEQLLQKENIVRARKSQLISKVRQIVSRLKL